MAAGDEAAPVNGADVLRCLRTATAREHAAVEAALDLMSPQLDRPRLTGVLTRLHAFWGAAEGGLDVWARRERADADAIDWRRRRRTALFTADLVVLGGYPASGRQPELPAIENTDDALGRLYVLEGSTLGGRFIDRHLATLPGLAPAGRLRAFSPYGPETGAMWQAFRRFARERAQDPRRVVAAAGATFGALADWCAPVAA